MLLSLIMEFHSSLVSLKLIVEVMQVQLAAFTYATTYALIIK